MGYFKNLDVEQQQAIDDVVSWWKSHEGHVPDYLMKMVIEDTRFWEKVRDRWLSEELSPRPAVSHVALQVSRRTRKQKRDWSMSHDDAVVVLRCFAFISVIAVGLLMWLAVTL